MRNVIIGIITGIVAFIVLILVLPSSEVETPVVQDVALERPARLLDTEDPDIQVDLKEAYMMGCVEEPKHLPFCNCSYDYLNDNYDLLNFGEDEIWEAVLHCYHLFVE